MYRIAESVGPFRVGDRPLVATPLTVEDDAGNPVSLTGVDATATLGTTSLNAAVVDDTIVITWPTASPFTTAGVFTLSVNLSNGSGSVSVAPLAVVVEAGDGWHTVSSIRAEWRDAPDDDGQLFELLTVARLQCAAWAGHMDAPGNLVPPSYRLAQRMQVRNVWNSSKTDPATGGIGDEGFVIRPFPLDWTIKAILRPPTAVPVVA